MTHIAFPHLTIPTSEVEASDWILQDASGRVSDLAAYLPDWDYSTDLVARRTLSVDLEPACAALSLDPTQTTFRVLVSVGTGEGSLPRRVRRYPCQLIDGKAEIAIDLPGRSLSHRLRLETDIVLDSAGAPGSPITPRESGARLWSDMVDTRLEGQEPRFPIELASFSKMFPGRSEAGALWMLHWAPGNPHQDFGGSVRLYVNSDSDDFSSRFLEADPLTLHTVMADVMTQMIDTTLASESAADLLSDCEETTVGGQIRSWLDQAFPGQDLAAVRRIRETNPGSFRSQIQAAADHAGAD